MKKRIQFFSVMLALALSLFGCTSTGSDPTDPSPSATVSTVTAQKWYADAVEKLQMSTELTLTYSYSQERIVGDDTFVTDLTGTTSYSGANTDDATAVVQQSISYGTYGVQYGELYDDGIVYIFANDCEFTGSCDWETFCYRQFPAVVLDASLYTTIQLEDTQEGVLLTFSGAAVPESWECASEDAQLISASGTALLDSQYHLRSYTYNVSYRWGAATYKTHLALSLSDSAQLEFPDHFESDPQGYVELDCLDAPKLLLRSVGDIFTAHSFTSQVDQTVTSAALDLIRIDQNSYSLSGIGKNLIASADYQVTLSDYRGSTTSTTQTDRYENGIFTRISNGGAPVETNETPENIRIRWENSILNGLFALTYLDGAELTETDDFYILDLTGNDAYRNAISSSLNTVFSSDLDSLATSYTDSFATGYLTINKQTGLPTAMGMAFSRTHVLYGVAYPVTFQLDQSLRLSQPETTEDVSDDTYDPLQPTPLFYKVTGSDGQQLWLLGTIHVGDERINNLPTQLLDALQESDALAVEYDMNAFLSQVAEDPTLQNSIAQLYYYQDGSKVTDHLPADSVQALSELLTVSGNANSTASYMRPVFLASLIEEFYLEQGYRLSSDMGVDVQLLELANIMSKEIISIESGLSQLQIMASFSDGLQQLLLNSTINSSLSSYNQITATLYELWCQGDAEQIYPLLFREEGSLSDDELAYWQEYDQALITTRNASMLKSAIECLESGDTVFYAVGLAHLLGEDGLVTQLEAAGYTVQQVTYDKT